MRDYTAEIAAKKNELQKKLAAKSSVELMGDVIEKSVPTTRGEWAGYVGALVLGGVAADMLIGPVSLIGNVGAVLLGTNSAALAYQGVRSGVMARDEWAELARRGIRKVIPQKEKPTGHKERMAILEELAEKNGVTPLEPTPELVAQAMALQGRRL